MEWVVLAEFIVCFAFGMPGRKRGAVVFCAFVYLFICLFVCITYAITTYF
jgi:hypothetical protein